MSARPTAASGGAGRAALLAAAAALIAIHLVAAVLVWRRDWEPSLYAAALEGVPWLVAVALVLSGRSVPSLATVVAVAVVLRLVALPLDPFFSTDVFRYIWEGRIQAAGFSPYLHIPADPVLEPYRDAIWERVNRASYAPTIYPPVAQAFFFLVTRISETVTFMKLAMVGCEAVAVWAATRLCDDIGLPRRNLIVVLWCPIAVWEIAGNGHVDALMAALVALALLASRMRRDALAGLALGAAVLVKFIPLAIAPALWRRWDLKLPLALAAVIVLAYAPHVLTAGASVVGFMPTYATEEGIATGSGFWLMRGLAAVGAAPPLGAYFALVLALAAGLAVSAAFLVRRDEPRPLTGHALALAAVALLAISPAFPWYFFWLLVILSVRFFWPLTWLMAAGPLLYLDHGRQYPELVVMVYGGTVLLAALAAVRGRRR